MNAAVSKKIVEESIFPSFTRIHGVFRVQLGARRALDFASFFGSRHPRLAGLKEKQAELYGALQTLAVRRKWTRVADSLGQLARVETEFREALVSS